MYRVSHKRSKLVRIAVTLFAQLIKPEAIERCEVRPIDQELLLNDSRLQNITEANATNAIARERPNNVLQPENIIDHTEI